MATTVKEAKPLDLNEIAYLKKYCEKYPDRLHHVETIVNVYNLGALDPLLCKVLLRNVKHLLTLSKLDGIAADTKLLDDAARRVEREADNQRDMLIHKPRVKKVRVKPIPAPAVDPNPDLPVTVRRNGKRPVERVKSMLMSGRLVAPDEVAAELKVSKGSAKGYLSKASAALPDYQIKNIYGVGYQATSLPK